MSRTFTKYYYDKTITGAWGVHRPNGSIMCGFVLEENASLLVELLNSQLNFLDKTVRTTLFFKIMEIRIERGLPI